MLSRNADSLYWMARYMERADYLARILDATLRLTALPASYAGEVGSEWSGAVASAGLDESFAERGEPADERSVAEFLAFSPANPGSIVSCLSTARTNARAIRTSLTIEMWETINGAWNDLRRFDGQTLGRESLTRFLDWIKGVNLAFDGAAHRTMLRNDGYDFLRLGSSVERADNTARILDVKYHLLLPKAEPVGGGLDYFQWSTILREVSALTAYRWVYRGTIQPWLVADLLTLNRQMPRSLASCCETSVRHLEALSDAYGRRGAAQRQAADMLARLEAARIEDVFQSGLHEFIQRFLDDNNRLGALIAEQYLV